MFLFLSTNRDTKPVDNVHYQQRVGYANATTSVPSVYYQGFHTNSGFFLKTGSGSGDQATATQTLTVTVLDDGNNLLKRAIQNKDTDEIKTQLMKNYTKY